MQTARGVRVDEKSRVVSGALARWLPSVVAVFGLLLTLLSVVWERDRVATADRQAFSALTERLRGEIARRVGVYRYGLMGTRSALATRGTLSRAEFRRLAAARDMPAEFPGALGIGYIERVERADLEDFVERVRADEDPGFVVSSEGHAPDLMVIRYIEPLAENRAAVGSDIGREARRRAAAECAMLAGEACVSDVLTLVQAADSGPGFLYLLPFYRGGVTPVTSEARRRELRGFIYMPLLARDIFSGAAAITDGHLDFEVFTGELTDREHLVYDDDGHLQDLKNRVTAADFADRRLHVSVPVEIGKQRWTATMSTTAKFRGSRSFAWELGAGGAALSLLLGMLLQVMGEAGRKARSLANAMTSELQKLATIVERSTNLVLTTDPEQRITWVNEGFTRVTGYALAEVVGKRPAELLQFEKTCPNTKAEMREKLLSKQPYRGEILNRGKYGREFWLDVNIQPLLSEQGELVGFMAIESDITTRKRAEAEVAEGAALLAASNAALEEAQAVGRLGNWTIDAETFRVTWSKQLYRLFEHDDLSYVPSYEESLAQFAPEDAVRLDAAARRALSDGTEFSITARTRPGRAGVRHLRCDGRVRVESGRAIGLYGTVIDMTAEVEREEALRFARERAEDASRSKSEFLANMSHEIRTPMAAILGYSELLADELRAKSVSTVQLEYLETIRRNGEHLLTIINDILDISKIEAGKLTVERSEVQADVVLADVMSTMAAHADAKRIALSVAWLTPIPRTVHTDAVRLRQILLNVIGNALKFTERGSVDVRVQYEPRTSCLRVVIVDTGVGISPEQGARLFEAFSQADSSTTRRFGGSGLGLRISKRLAQALGGDLTFTSELGQGSVFTLTIACGVSASAELFSPDARGTKVPSSPQPPAPSEQHPLAGVRILLAEDGVDNQRLIALHLRRAGAEVRIADNGRLALESLTSDGTVDGSLREPAPVDVVISDIQMPELDGYAVAAALQRGGFRGVLIALTAHAMESERKRCLAAGFHDHLAKPIDRVALVQTVVRNLTKLGAEQRARARAAS